MEPFDGLCLGCGFSKVCQYATIDNKVYVGVPCTFIKVAQGVILEMYFMAQFLWKKEASMGQSLNWIKLKCKVNTSMKTT